MNEKVESGQLLTRIRESIYTYTNIEYCIRIYILISNIKLVWRVNLPYYEAMSINNVTYCTIDVFDLIYQLAIYRAQEPLFRTTPSILRKPSDTYIPSGPLAAPSLQSQLPTIWF